MKAWRPSTWGDEISLEYGKALRGYELARGPVRVFGSNGPVGWTDKALATGPGVILGRKGAYRLQYSEGDFFVIDTAYYVVPKADLDMRWLYYAIQYHKLGEIDDGSPIPSTTRAAVYVRELDVPPKDVQREMARILESIDNKIDLNRRINKTLESMAQAIFQSWFVDFDPVKAKIAAKAEGRDPLRAAMSAICGKADAELDALPPAQYEQLAATAALFPDEMEASELGGIPKGWAVCPLPECVGINPARALKKGAVAPYLDMANVPTNAARVDNVITRAFGSGSKFINGDTLLARITPCLENGKTAYVDFLADGEVGWGSTEFIVLRPKVGLPLPFAYFLCRHPEFRAFAISQMAGTSGRQRVPNDCFGSYKVVKPSVLIAEAFGKQTTQFMRQIKSLDEESKTLAGLRDALLPRLLSGELQVPHAEAEAVA
jgi:type I restriction enzyme S subunit